MCEEMPDCPICGEQRFNLQTHIERVHSKLNTAPAKIIVALPTISKRQLREREIETKITPDKLRRLMASLDQHYGPAFIKGKFP